MGTDIHIQVQGRNSDGIWEYVKRHPFPRFNINDDGGYSYDDDPTVRNYRLFALLADVRNGSGFAGVYTHEPVNPCFAGRGLPDGLSFDDCEFWDDDGDSQPGFTGGDSWVGEHSATHATLAELRAVDYGITFEVGGIVSREVFNETAPGECPESWCDDVSGPGVSVCAEPETFAKDMSFTHCRIRWAYAPLEDCAFKRWIFGEMMSAFAAEYGGPENVRVLMGFDS